MNRYRTPPSNYPGQVDQDSWKPGLLWRGKKQFAHHLLLAVRRAFSQIIIIILLLLFLLLLLLLLLLLSLSFVYLVLNFILPYETVRQREAPIYIKKLEQLEKKPEAFLTPEMTSRSRLLFKWPTTSSHSRSSGRVVIMLITRIHLSSFLTPTFSTLQQRSTLPTVTLVPLLK